MPKTDLTVIIVNYNSGPLLQQAVTAVLASTASLELLVCDNASSDSSFKNLAANAGSDSRLTLIENVSNLGFAAANNIALGQSKSEFILLLNPDCLVQPDTFARMLHTLRQYPDVGMAGCRILNPDGSEQAGCRRMLPDAGSGIARAFGIRRSSAVNIDLNTELVPENPVYVEAISGAFMLLRQQALSDVGPLDEDYFLHCEDLDWCKRFADAGWKILFVPSVEVIHHQGTCSQRTPVRVSWHKHNGMARYYRKFLAADRFFLFNWVVYVGIYLRFLMLGAGSGLKRLFRTVD